MSLPAPYWQSDDGRHTLYCGDCLAILPHVGRVDCVVTSPPYNIAGGTHAPSGRYRNAPLNISKRWYDDSLPEAEYQSWLNRVIKNCRECCGGLVWVNHKTRFVDKSALHPARFIKQPIYSEVIWARSGATAFNCRKFAPSHEVILGLGVPHYWNDDANTMLTVWRVHQDATDHPCSFPVEIPLRLLYASCPDDGLALDPFAGSGTTMVAAHRTGRRSIGIEIEPKYCEIAKRRMERELAQPFLPGMEPHAETRQAELFEVSA